MDFPPSEEQEVILQDIASGENIIGDCVAGSGKTTTVLFVAKRFPKRRILQITYNSQLKLEVREKVVKQGINNLEIHTYHSLCVKYYDQNGRDDAVMRRVIEKNVKPKIPIPVFDTLILDETQDMKDLFYNLIVKFRRDMRDGASANMLVLGDRYQAVYKFMGADSRFLTLTHDIWKHKTFKNRFLSTSYRLTNEIAAFVNNVMLGYPRIRTVRSGGPVTYIRDNVFQVYRKLAVYINGLLHGGSIKPEDIFVLAGSIAGDTSPLRKLENELVDNNIPCYYPTSDERKLDEDIIEGKVIFSSFHQAKGRERKVVIVYGFDSGYFKYFGKDYDPLVCPETLYVACTRASEKLILVEGSGPGIGPLPFLKMNHMQIDSLSYVDFSGKSVGFMPYKQEDAADNFHKTTPTDLVKFLKECHMKSLIPLIDGLFNVEVGEQYCADIPSKISFESGLHEEVSDINGIVIPAMYEARKGESTVQRVVRDNYLQMSQKEEHAYLKEGFKKYMNQDCVTIADNLYLGALYICMNEKLYHKIKQITRYDWLSQRDAELCWNTLDLYLGCGGGGSGSDVIYEQDIETISDNYSAHGVIQVTGRFDAVTDDTIWELKCVETLTIEHLLQVVVYAWLWRCEYLEKLGSRKFKILNMRTGKVMVLNTESHLIDEVMQVLFENKYGKAPVLSDTEFIERCHRGVCVNVGASILSNTGGECCLIEDD